MATLPLHTIAYLLKESDATACSAFRGIIAQLMQQPMPRGALHFFINKGHSLRKAV